MKTVMAQSNLPPLHLSFEGGTICLSGLTDEMPKPPADWYWDDRKELHRAPGLNYAEIVRWLREQQLPYEDQARDYAARAASNIVRQEPYYFQREALQAWTENQGRGVVVLPTGSGKTFLATLAMDHFPRTTLIVVPTLDLLNQWYDLLCTAFSTDIGIIGGGYYEPRELTVITYDSAHIHMDRLGNRFGMVVFDECHHLPSESYALAARCCIAPFRLGLTATPERNDGREALYAELIGPTVYRKDIDELSGSYLASYETQRIAVSLSKAEREEYDEERNLYLSFLRKHGIRMGSARAWGDFIIRSSRNEEGRRAFAAYRRQRQLTLTAQGKLQALQRLIHAHRHDRIIIFTEDNATVYDIARRFLLPAITHQTKVKERSFILKAFNAGTLNAVVTSKVLNEGVNVPEANVAVVLSGSGSVREHVQRLGRVLRKRGNKRAVMYELVSANTSEESVSARRRDHRAYQ